MLEKFDSAKWPGVTIQLVILTINVGFLLKEIVNSYILLSFVLALSVFGLQITNVRFLWLYPIRWPDRKPTEKMDTLVLRFYLLFASISLAIGTYFWFLVMKADEFKEAQFSFSIVLSFAFSALKYLDLALLKSLFYLSLLFGMVIPLCFLFHWNERIRRELELDQRKFDSSKNEG